MLTDEQVVSLVDNEFDTALGAPGGDISLERAEAFDYYLSKPFGNEEEGSSQVVSSDVSDVVDGIMPSLLRMFTTADNLVSFDAVGKFGPDGKPDEKRTIADERAADQESDYVSHVFFKRNPAFEIIFFWLFDALVQKNGYVKCWWDESEETTNESYEGLSDLEVADLMSDDELEPVERSERQAETLNEFAQITIDTVHDIKFKRVKKVGSVVVENVPPDEQRVSNDAKSLDPSKARMSGHEREVTRSELLEMGFDKKTVDELPAEDDAIASPEEVARKDKSDDRRSNKNEDKSQDKILLREAYMKVDVNEDGRSELKQIFVANGKMLEMTDADRQPFHCICPHPIPHKHFGRATAEKVMDIQLVGSTVERGVLDNIYHTNKPGHAVWEQGIGENTMDDLLTTRIGAVRRFRRPVNESYAPMTVPFTAAQTFPMLEYFDKVKKDRTGIASDSEGLSPEALKNIQTTVMAQATDLSKMKVETIARVFAETGFMSLFGHIHELLQKHQKDADIVKLRGAWTQVRPSEWRTRRDMTVNIGLGIGTREQNLLHLNAIWEKQSEMVEGGGMNLTVTPKNIFNTAAEIVKNANLKLPSMFFTDPGDKPAPPQSSEAEELKKRELALQERQQKLDNERNQVNAAKLELQGQKQAMDHQKEVAKLEEQREERLDKFANENEKLRNELSEIQLKFVALEEDREIKGETAIAGIGLTKAQAMESRARTAKIVEETEAQQIENAATDSGITNLVEDDGGSEEAE